jgi:hypothetical protein
MQQSGRNMEDMGRIAFARLPRIFRLFYSTSLEAWRPGIRRAGKSGPNFGLDCSASQRTSIPLSSMVHKRHMAFPLLQRNGQSLVYIAAFESNPLTRESLTE